MYAHTRAVPAQLAARIQAPAWKMESKTEKQGKPLR